MRKRSRPTMADVAKSAGVSQTTVSFVLNDVAEASIPEETRERVRKAVEELGYRPNTAAQSLRTKYSHLVGFITDEIATSPFAGNIIKAAQELATTNNKMLLLVNTGGDPELEAAAVEMLLQRQVDGIVYAAMYMREVQLPKGIHEVPTVLVNCYSTHAKLPTVIPDEQYGGKTVTSILLDKGHRRIGFINGEPGFDAAQERLKGYANALRAHGIKLDDALISHGSWWPDNGYENTRRLMSLIAPPTAIFCGNDRIAIGAYGALKELGLKVPDDLAVIGYDGEDIAAYLNPPLSTFTLPHAEMGHWGVKLLLKGKANTAPQDHHVKRMRGRYIERSSC